MKESKDTSYAGARGQIIKSADLSRNCRTPVAQVRNLQFTGLYPAERQYRRSWAWKPGPSRPELRPWHVTSSLISREGTAGDQDFVQPLQAPFWPFVHNLAGNQGCSLPRSLVLIGLPLVHRQICRFLFLFFLYLVCNIHLATKGGERGIKFVLAHVAFSLDTT